MHDKLCTMYKNAINNASLRSIYPPVYFFVRAARVILLFVRAPWVVHYFVRDRELYFFHPGETSRAFFVRERELCFFRRRFWAVLVFIQLREQCFSSYETSIYAYFPRYKSYIEDTNKIVQKFSTLLFLSIYERRMNLLLQVSV